NAIHMYALGPIAVGELVQAQSRCGAVGPNGPRTPTVLAAPPMPAPANSSPAATDSGWLPWAVGGAVVVAGGATAASWTRRRRRQVSAKDASSEG
ncbi:MAG TPA: hypothetical protein VM121_04830, partial [Acidimicrobiales bacterium]|nr:hypothetical protein [Acidimicrobiales bacterium]